MNLRHKMNNFYELHLDKVRAELQETLDTYRRQREYCETVEDYEDFISELITEIDTIVENEL